VSLRLVFGELGERLVDHGLLPAVEDDGLAGDRSVDWMQRSAAHHPKSVPSV